MNESHPNRVPTRWTDEQYLLLLAEAKTPRNIPRLIRERVMETYADGPNSKALISHYASLETQLQRISRVLPELMLETSTIAARMISAVQKFDPVKRSQEMEMIQRYTQDRLQTFNKLLEP